ncbi:MAG: hypothetical protein ABSE08_02645 [Syntrophobacteraceae bacterium]
MRAIILAGLLLFMAAPVLAADQDIPKSKGVSSKEAYELSEKCAKFAAEKFKQGFTQEGCKREEDGMYCSTYSNHYSPKLNKCFMLIRTMYHPKDKDAGVGNMKSVLDIHENREIATLYVDQKANFNWKTLDCRVQDQDCKSESEWDVLVKPYMEDEN